jgi:hypothetical protein
VNKWTINPFTSPNPVYSHTHKTWEYFTIFISICLEDGCSMLLRIIESLTNLHGVIIQMTVVWHVTYDRSNHRQAVVCKLWIFPSASVCFLLALFFCPEDGGDMFVRNVGISPNYTALQPRQFHTHHCERLKPYVFKSIVPYAVWKVWYPQFGPWDVKTGETEISQTSCTFQSALQSSNRRTDQRSQHMEDTEGGRRYGRR